MKKKSKTVERGDGGEGILRKRGSKRDTATLL